MLCWLQATLLDAATNLVQPDGILVYSTCSIEADENVLQITSFLERHTDFHMLAASRPVIPESLLAGKGCLRVLQHKHGIEGAFAAVLRRKMVM